MMSIKEQGDAEGFVEGMATSLTRVSSTRERLVSPPAVCNARVGISERAARSKAQIPDSTLDDAFGDWDDLPRLYAASTIRCHGVECKLLRSEQTLSKSAGSAGLVSKFFAQSFITAYHGPPRRSSHLATILVASRCHLDRQENGER